MLRKEEQEMAFALECKMQRGDMVELLMMGLEMNNENPRKEGKSSKEGGSVKKKSGSKGEGSRHKKRASE